MSIRPLANVLRFWLLTTRIIAVCGLAAAQTLKPLSVHTPTAVLVGSSPVASGLAAYSAQTFLTLNQSAPVATIDYGLEVEGWPFLLVSDFDKSAEIEYKFTEAFDGLKAPDADGPYPFANGLSNTFRTERVNITKTGKYESPLLQGGLRWQSVSLLSGGPIYLKSIGLRPSLEIKSLDSLPGSFRTSKQTYNDVWVLGARTVQIACVPASSQTSTWTLTDQGVLIPGQQPAQSALGTTEANYTMTFQTKSVKGGFGWRVATTLGGVGPYFVVTTQDYPQRSISSTNFPPNSLVTGFGYNLINQTTLDSAYVQVVPLTMKLSSDEWYSVGTKITDEGYEISINNIHIVTVTYAQAMADPSNPVFGPIDPRSGTWGFGPFLDQIAYVRNVEVLAVNGTKIYSNDMLSAKVLNEYSINTNSHSVCLDGSKRDRLVWMGDFVHTTRTLLSTTNRTDFIRGTLDYVFSFQNRGLIAFDPPLGASSQYKEVINPGLFGLTDYDMFTLLIIGDYYLRTGDTAYVSGFWPQIKELAAVLIGKINPSTGLVAGTLGDYYFISGGQQDATAIGGLLSVALQRLVPIAAALNDGGVAELYASTARNLTTAVNRYLWSDNLESYAISLQDLGNYSISATAFAILSGAANTTQATLSISKLSSLFLEIGYKDTSAVQSSNTTQLSAFLQGFLLESLFYAHRYLNVSSSVVTPVISNLLDGFWPHMTNGSLGNNEYYTGTTWEYLYPNGSPGIGLFTSHAHPWSSSPTYIMSDYILGVRPSEPGFEEFTVDPVLVKDLGIEYAKGQVPTPSGMIEASWRLGGQDEVLCTVKAPKGNKANCSGRSCSNCWREWS